MVLAEDKQSDEPIINWILCRRPFPFVQAHGGWSLEGVNSCPPLYSEHVVSCLQFPDASSQPDSRRKRWVSIRYSILSRPGGIVQKNKRAEDNHSSLLALIFHRCSYAQGGRKKKVWRTQREPGGILPRRALHEKWPARRQEPLLLPGVCAPPNAQSLTKSARFLWMRFHLNALFNKCHLWMLLRTWRLDPHFPLFSKMIARSPTGRSSSASLWRYRVITHLAGTLLRV